MKRNDDDNEGGNEKLGAAVLILAIFILGFGFGQYSAVKPHCSASSFSVKL